MNSIDGIGKNQAAILQSMEQMKMQAANVNKVDGHSFSTAMSNAVKRSNEVQMNSASLTERFIAGDPSVTMGEVVGANQQASIALEMTNQVKNKVITSYNEILNITF
ncbi:Flagellar hook-basal body complex protein FliE [Vibrio chagasii]|nr:Flagellar hook-basal body complex protein FliE [Vibrio chagasii]